MKVATAGFGFTMCLLSGVIIGILFDSFKVGGALGLGVGLIVLSIFRKNKK